MRSLKTRRLAPFLFFIMTSFVATSAAQVCWRQSPNAVCSSFPITDFTIAAPIAGVSGAPQRHVDFATNLGRLFKTNARLAFGPAFFFSAYLNGGWHSQWGMHARARVQLNNKWHVQISPGLIISDSPFPNGFAGYHAQVEVMFKDWVGLSARADRVRLYPDDRETIVHIGIKTGSYIGMGATAVGAVAGGLAFLASRID